MISELAPRSPLRLLEDLAQLAQGFAAIGRPRPEIELHLAGGSLIKGRLAAVGRGDDRSGPIAVVIVGGSQRAPTAAYVRIDHVAAVTVSDAAIVVRKEDGKVKVRQANDLVGPGALGGAFWGMLIGLLFMMPWLGLAIGAVSGAIAGKYTDIGIDDDFIKEVGGTIQPGQSALFLLIEQWTEEKVLPELAGYDATILRTNLSAEAEAKLRAAFGALEDD